MTNWPGSQLTHPGFSSMRAKNPGSPGWLKGTLSATVKSVRAGEIMVTSENSTRRLQSRFMPVHTGGKRPDDISLAGLL